ncbi:hypothetical protein [Arthrobacter mobilis]|uniref:Uncharacterized protein n=1 Tax=Arthrobacter mobilis TaxID=2724944 RepID=A0A7X6H9J1_9MICC|nr:hypothetical protein [Arthrobacter mobilis]NKX52976.1 hypothetical protein [Arthrobacter mobilis]
MRGPLRAVGPQAALVNADGRAITAVAYGLEAGDLTTGGDGAPAGRSFRILQTARPR